MRPGLPVTASASCRVLNSSLDGLAATAGAHTRLRPEERIVGPLRVHPPPLSTTNITQTSNSYVLGPHSSCRPPPFLPPLLSHTPCRQRSCSRSSSLSGQGSCRRPPRTPPPVPAGRPGSPRPPCYSPQSSGETPPVTGLSCSNSRSRRPSMWCFSMRRLRKMREFLYLYS